MSQISQGFCHFLSQWIESDYLPVIDYSCDLVSSIKQSGEPTILKIATNLVTQLYSHKRSNYHILFANGEQVITMKVNLCPKSLNSAISYVYLYVSGRSSPKSCDICFFIGKPRYEIASEVLKFENYHGLGWTNSYSFSRKELETSKWIDYEGIPTVDYNQIDSDGMYYISTRFVSKAEENNTRTIITSCNVIIADADVLLSSGYSADKCTYGEAFVYVIGDSRRFFIGLTRREILSEVLKLEKPSKASPYHI